MKTRYLYMEDDYHPFGEDEKVPVKMVRFSDDTLHSTRNKRRTF